jgi:hypothetical protein
MIQVSVSYVSSQLWHYKYFMPSFYPFHSEAPIKFFRSEWGFIVTSRLKNGGRGYWMNRHILLHVDWGYKHSFSQSYTHNSYVTLWQCCFWNVNNTSQPRVNPSVFVSCRLLRFLCNDKDTESGPQEFESHNLAAVVERTARCMWKWGVSRTSVSFHLRDRKLMSPNSKHLNCWSDLVSRSTSGCWNC